MEITEDSLFLKLGLYSPIKFSELEVRIAGDFFLDDSHLQFDCYCTECQKESTFKFFSRALDSPYNYLGMKNTGVLEKFINSLTRSVTLIFACQRDNSHKYTFTFRIKDFEITKIGQFPSSASIELHSIEKYRKVLTDHYKDFSKAIGLHSHGIGAGSFVYLRRIFENLIEDKHLEAQQTQNWNESDYKQVSMDERIKLLKDFLPPFLVENRKLYSILSKGIHDLTEDECLQIFPDVKLAIELILDEKIYLQEQQNKIKQARKFVSSTVERLKS